MTVKKITPVLFAEEIEPCLKFWVERLGFEKTIEVPTLVECGSCKGAGSADGQTSTCGTCRGHGRVRMQNGIFSIQQACPHCGGSGKVIANPCEECRGEGRVEDDRTLSVKIPAGVDTGDRIRLSGQGEAGPSGAPSGGRATAMRSPTLTRCSGSRIVR